MSKAVFLDRDGVINAAVITPGGLDSPRSADEFQLLPTAGRAIRALNEHEFRVAVVSNQPGVAKGKFSRDDLDALTELMKEGLQEEGARVDAVYYCLHHPDAIVDEYRTVCECRKPNPGLLIQAARDLGLKAEGSYMVGDQARDMIAGKRIGCSTVFVGADRTSAPPEADYVCSDLASAVDLIFQLEGVTAISVMGGNRWRSLPIPPT